MKISIITVVYNNAGYIEDCIKSVITQVYPDIEYIIIDGASTDGTPEIINRYKDRIAKVVSEKDNGYVYAMNKGLRYATGDVVGFLNSDDFYADTRVIERVSEAFKNKRLDSVYGDLVYVKKNNPMKVIRYWRSGQGNSRKIKYGWVPPHPTFFIKREFYEKHGYFNTDFKIAADYELILRLLYKYGISSFNINEVLVKMRWGGISNRSITNIIEKTREDYRACRIYRLGISTVVMKNVIKLPQFLTRTYCYVGRKM